MTDFPERIVYVDDDQQMRNLVREALTRSEEEHMLVTCNTGQELIDRFKELQPDLILLDLAMPEMNGPDTIAALHAQEGGQDIPVVFITGKTKVEMVDEYKSLGVVGVIHKPFSVKDLAPQIKEFYAASKNAA